MSESAGIEPIFVSVKQAAEMLGGISPWSVYQLLDEKKVACRYHGRRRLVDFQSLREYAAGLPEERPEGEEGQ